MYFMIKDENKFHRYMAICEKVNNIIKKKIYSELIYYKKCHKRKLSMFLYTSNIV